MEGFSKEGRKLRPRRSAAGESRHTNGQHTDYEKRSSFGEQHRSYSDRPRRSFGGDRKPFDGEHRATFGGGRHEGAPGHSFGGERRSYPDRPRRDFGGDRKPFDGERRATFGGGRSEGAPGHSFGGERRSYPDRPRRNSGGDRKGFGDRPYRKSNSKYAFTKESEEGINRMIERRPVVDNRESDFDYTSPVKEEIRLNKYIANSGVCSRREADTLIQAGVVTVNGEVVTELGVKVNILKDDIRFNGERLKGEEKVYIVMNKPKGYVTTASDPHADKTVMDLLKGCQYRVYPVGRLDKATTGVLMLTNDGEIAEKLTHPSYDKKKIYQVILDHNLAQEDYDRILAGVTLSDGPISADSLEYIDENDKRKLGIEIHSGKNRIVRRIFESLGYEVRTLDRVYFAGLTKKGLKKGEWRMLTEGEANILKMGAYL